MKQASTLLVVVFLTFFQLGRAAWNATTDRDCSRLSLCLTSFIWCDESGENKGCNYPEDAYPLFDRKEPTNPAMLISTRNYTISWKKADPNYPVRIQWLMPPFASESVIAPRWDFNTTVPAPTSFVFNPYQILKDVYGLQDLYPYDSPNVTNATDFMAALYSGTSIGNIIRISQPERARAENNNLPYAYTDYSDQFSIQNGWVPRYMKAQRSIVAGKYQRGIRLGVGIGVGLGVPFIMAITAVVTWLVLNVLSGTFEWNEVWSSMMLDGYMQAAAAEHPWMFWQKPKQFASQQPLFEVTESLNSHHLQNPAATQWPTKDQQVVYHTTYRTEMQQGEIQIAYGRDRATGFFLAVYDARLAWSLHNSAALNAICNGIAESGSGCYLHAHTGHIGFGPRVSIVTMKELWRKYGVSEEMLKMLSDVLENQAKYASYFT
ncbi:hypothetical protein MBLNU457_g0755t1 [Dothideomycetes sp. NU457]